MSGVLAIIGAGGHGRVVADAALEAGWREVAFFDDRFPELEKTLDWPIVGTFGDLVGRLDRYDGIFPGMGDNHTRLTIINQLMHHGKQCATVVHPRAWVSRRALVGAGCFVAAGAVVGIGSVVARGSIINTSATVDHDCVLGESVHIAPGAHVAGTVEIGSRAWIGVGASIRQGVRIGADVVVGAGAAVICDIADSVVAFGVPARPRS